MKPYILQEHKWRIAADGSHSYMLQKASMVRGQPRWRTEGYYRTLEGCLREYQRRLTLDSDKALPDALSESLQALQTALDQLETKLTVTL